MLNMLLDPQAIHTILSVQELNDILGFRPPWSEAAKEGSDS